MENGDRHWTDRSFQDFQFRIASDFVAQLESRLEELGWSHAQFAQKLGLTEGRISQLLNNPGNLGLSVMVKTARALDMKLAVIAYDDGDKGNQRGPISAEVFRLCWEKSGKPSDFWALDQSITGALVCSGPIWGKTYSLTTCTSLTLGDQAFEGIYLSDARYLNGFLTDYAVPTVERDAA